MSDQSEEHHPVCCECEGCMNGSNPPLQQRALLEWEARADRGVAGKRALRAARRNAYKP